MWAKLTITTFILLTTREQIYIAFLHCNTQFYCWHLSTTIKDWKLHSFRSHFRLHTSQCTGQNRHTMSVYIMSIADGSWLMQKNLRRKSCLYKFYKGTMYFPYVRFISSFHILEIDKNLICSQIKTPSECATTAPWAVDERAVGVSKVLIWRLLRQAWSMFLVWSWDWVLPCLF